MEKLLGDSDDVQPQDLSSIRSLPAVMDLTRKGEECLLKANSMEALRVVKPPSWYPNSGSSKGLSFPETDHRCQPVDQIQPDNAFPNNTVTLSYVSRSHVFSTHDSLSQHSSFYGVPSISRFSTMDGFLQQVDRPLGSARRSDMFDSIPPAQVVGENVAGVCLMQQSHEINGDRVASNGVEKYKSQQRGGSMRHTLSQDTDNEGLQNGQGSSSWSNSAICVDSSPESLTTDMEGERRASEVLFLISRTEEPVLMQDSRSPRDLCSQNGEYISPLEDPASPSASPSVSLYDVEDGLILPQVSCSPCADNSLADETADTCWDELERGGPGLFAVQGTRPNGDNTPRLDYRKDYQQPGHKAKAASEPIVDLTEDESTVPEVLEKKNKQTATSHLKGSVEAEQRTSERKQLPPRSGRGTRLEAIVMNINPNWYKVSTKKPKASKAQPQTNPLTQSSPSKAGVSPNKQTLSVVKKVQNKAASSSEGENKVKAAASLTGRMYSIYTNTDRCKESTSDSDHNRFLKYPHNRSTSPIKSSLPFAPDKDSEKELEHRESGPEPSSAMDVLIVSPSHKASPKKPGNHKAKTTSSVAAAPTTKTRKPTPAPKKKRKKPRLDQSSMFSPQEPEIKLKYIKEKKRDMRVNTFSPFIHVERKPSSTSPANCTVINFPEEEKPRQKGQVQQQAGGSGSGGFIPGAVPSTSCLQLGRISTHSQYHSTLVCCLCGGSANAMDLGDLHGPYYPEGYRPSTKAPASKPGLKEEEEDFSDSDSSCSVRGRGRKCARHPGVPWPHKPVPRLNHEGLLGRWTSDSDPSLSPGAKRARTEAGPGVTSGAGPAVDDWYIPPVVPLGQCEYWLHEDCSIWSAGVFLVKGRVYGLEEAVKVAQETTCSRCRNPGATLGCFFKGCPNKYHYRCSLQSDCVLNEENFSMKCTKHKNKSFQGPPGSRRDDR